MANYEKQLEQEAAYPIPISLYNCYRTVRQEKRGIAIYILLIAFLMPHCPVTVVQRYRDGVCSLLFHLFFIICHPYIPLHLEEMIFYTCFTDFWLCGMHHENHASRCKEHMCNGRGRSSRCGNIVNVLSSIFIVKMIHIE